MSLNAQAIAVSGYGFGAQMIAVSGYGEYVITEQVYKHAARVTRKPKKKRKSENEEALLMCNLL